MSSATVSSATASSDSPVREESRIELLTRRRSTGRLCEPGPDRADLESMVTAACAAPDHGRLRPWRFLVLEGSALQDLGAAFARAHAVRHPAATQEERVRTAAKAERAPVIVVVVARLVPHVKVREWEQLVAAGCAAQNLCLAATALGYGSMWRTGWLAEHPVVLAHLGLAEDERIVGFVYLGTVHDGQRIPPRQLDTGCVTWRTDRYAP